MHVPTTVVRLYVGMYVNVICRGLGAMRRMFVDYAGRIRHICSAWRNIVFLMSLRSLIIKVYLLKNTCVLTITRYANRNVVSIVVVSGISCSYIPFDILLNPRYRTTYTFSITLSKLFHLKQRLLQLF